VRRGDAGVGGEKFFERAAWGLEVFVLEAAGRPGWVAIPEEGRIAAVAELPRVRLPVTP
jgi:hypothetical protein